MTLTTKNFSQSLKPSKNGNTSSEALLTWSKFLQTILISNTFERIKISIDVKHDGHFFSKNILFDSDTDPDNSLASPMPFLKDQITTMDPKITRNKLSSQENSLSMPSNSNQTSTSISMNHNFEIRWSTTSKRNSSLTDRKVGTGTRDYGDIKARSTFPNSFADRSSMPIIPPLSQDIQVSKLPSIMLLASTTGQILNAKSNNTLRTATSAKGSRPSLQNLLDNFNQPKSRNTLGRLFLWTWLQASPNPQVTTRSLS